MSMSLQNYSVGTRSGGSLQCQPSTKALKCFTRTMKDAVKKELTIPPQTRYLVPIELGRVERHVRFSVIIVQR